MIKTSERLKLGANLYYQQFIHKIDIEKSNYPSVDYPEKAERYYFQQVNTLSGSKVEVVFLQRTYYKKVEGYRQVNYRKIRILSGTLFKEKHVSVKLDLTPSSLNDLKYHSNNNVSRNALGIISAIYRVDCYPSWARTEFLNLIHKKMIEKINNDAQTLRSNSDRDIRNEEAKKKENKKHIEREIEAAKIIKECMNKLAKKSIEAGFANHKVLKAVFTLGIYNLHCIYKKSKIKMENLQANLDKSIKRKQSFIEESHKIMDQLVELKNSRAELEANIAYLIKLEEQQYDFDNSEPIPPFAEPVTSNIVIKDSVTLIKPEYEYNIETFEVDSESLKGFVSIKNENIEKLKGLDIIGVYTVKNNETNSFYIGFTLDVEKSVREMFNNCVPTHPMMMKEYKESKIEDKSLLFEIKIKMVKTMSELLDAYLLFDKSFNGKFVHY